MGKRFTETCKWRDPFFCDLTPSEKLMWIYLCENCDRVGFWEENYRVAMFETGLSEGDIKDAIKKFVGKEKAKYFTGWIWLTKFIRHQDPKGYSEKSGYHTGAIELAEKHRIAGRDITEEVRLWIDYGKSKDSVSVVFVKGSEGGEKKTMGSLAKDYKEEERDRNGIDISSSEEDFVENIYTWAEEALPSFAPLAKRHKDALLKIDGVGKEKFLAAVENAKQFTKHGDLIWAVVNTVLSDNERAAARAKKESEERRR